MFSVRVLVWGTAQGQPLPPIRILFNLRMHNKNDLRYLHAVRVK